jgi:AraC-like DNA-binding protein
MAVRRIQGTEGHVEHTLPVAVVSQVVELLRRWRIPPAELLSAVSLQESVLENPLERLPVDVVVTLLERARTLTGEPGLGYYLGLQKRLSVYGYLGFAALSASSLGEALGLALRFAPLVSTAFSLSLTVEGDTAAVVVEENADLGTARDILLISLMIGLRTIAAALTGQAQPGAAELAIPEPAYSVRFAHLTPRWRFGQRFNRLLLKASVLDLPIATADPTGLRIARSLCERSLVELGIDTDLVRRVRELAPRRTGGFLSLGEMAARLGVSERTLRRRLAAQGLTFSALLERVRCDKAVLLLRSTDLSVQEIAETLDYADASTFVRAFHRWTGMPPSAYRRAHRSAPQGSAR